MCGALRRGRGRPGPRSLAAPAAGRLMRPRGGISVLVTSDEPSKEHRHDHAAVSSSLRVLRMRPRRLLAGRRPASPWISGMTATPVSKPLRPRASLGKSSSADQATIVHQPVPGRWQRLAAMYHCAACDVRPTTSCRIAGMADQVDQPAADDDRRSAPGRRRR